MDGNNSPITPFEQFQHCTNELSNLNKIVVDERYSRALKNIMQSLDYANKVYDPCPNIDKDSLYALINLLDIFRIKLGQLTITNEIDNEVIKQVKSRTKKETAEEILEELKTQVGSPDGWLPSEYVSIQDIEKTIKGVVSNEQAQT